ncbi:MAG: hypothetical protein QOH47_2114 [Sphingomonadales bacterium]|nr:hypothetical protein [Sphingomonadales bacterium]
MSRHFDNALFDQVQRLGALPTVKRWRGILRRETAAWIKAGCPSPAPDPVKLAIVRSYLNRGPRIFIETGTLTGVTVDYIARRREVFCYSIEVERRYFERARRVLSGRPNIELIFGDSAYALPELLAKISEPALFWLDAHYSAGLTGRGAKETAISEELAAIFAHPVKDHVILIDDARCFDGTGDFPTLSALLAAVDATGDYHAEISADIVRITPLMAR